MFLYIAARNQLCLEAPCCQSVSRANSFAKAMFLVSPCPSHSPYLSHPSQPSSPFLGLFSLPLLTLGPSRPDQHRQGQTSDPPSCTLLADALRLDAQTGRNIRWSSVASVEYKGDASCPKRRRAKTTVDRHGPFTGPTWAPHPKLENLNTSEALM